MLTFFSTPEIRQRYLRHVQALQALMTIGAQIAVLLTVRNVLLVISRVVQPVTPATWPSFGNQIILLE